MSAKGSILADILRQKTENLLAKSPDTFQVSELKSISESAHELVVYLAELEEQNNVLHATQLALQQTCDRFAVYFKQAPYGVLVADARGRYLEVNPAAEHISGYDADQLMTMGILDLLTPESHACGLKHFQTVVETGRTVGEMSFRRANGSIAYVNISGIRVGPDRYLGFVEDITERKKRQERIALLGHMLDEAPVAILVHDYDGNLFFSNRRNVCMHGYDSEEEFFAINLHQLDVPESEALLAERFQQISEQGEASFEVAHFCKDGTTVPLEVTSRGIQWNGQPAILSISVDITERKEACAEREKLQAQLNQAQKLESIGRLAGGVAHDYNNMLSVILGYTELALEKHALPSPVRADLYEIQKAAKCSAKLTGQLLTFARKQAIMPKVLDLNKTIDSMYVMLKRLIGEDIDLLWKPGTGLATVRIDSGQIDQMLANLVVNARDAIGNTFGKIIIETANVRIHEDYCSDHAGDCTPGNYVMLAVSDDGCGMDNATRSQIFEPFFTTKTLGKGTGLGLAMVYGIVKQNNGFVHVYSELKQGTTFKIYLPSQLTSAAHVPENGPGRLTNRGHETVLVVEDEPVILKLVTIMLEREGYSVMAAGTPNEALRLANAYEGDIHLLLSDVIMPEMNGRDLVLKIRSRHCDLRCLYMSGYTANVIGEQGIWDTEVNFLPKPFSKSDLIGKVREVLDRE
jgi:PAS domain S-box-containing protein